jgi:hypothetical protein
LEAAAFQIVIWISAMASGSNRVMDGVRGQKTYTATPIRTRRRRRLSTNIMPLLHHVPGFFESWNRWTTDKSKSDLSAGDEIVPI